MTRADEGSRHPMPSDSRTAQQPVKQVLPFKSVPSKCSPLRGGRNWPSLVDLSVSGISIGPMIAASARNSPEHNEAKASPH